MTRMIAASSPTAMIVETHGLVFIWTGGMYTDIYISLGEDEVQPTDLCMAMKDMDGEKVIPYGNLPMFMQRVIDYLEVL